MWPNGSLPEEGDNVLIEAHWRVELDVDPPTLNHLRIKGTLIIPDDRGAVKLSANSIWIQGDMKAGSSSSSFKNNF